MGALAQLKRKLLYLGLFDFPPPVLRMLKKPSGGRVKSISNKLSRSPMNDVKIHVECEQLRFPCTTEFFNRSWPVIVVKVANSI